MKSAYDMLADYFPLMLRGSPVWNNIEERYRKIQRDARRELLAGIKRIQNHITDFEQQHLPQGSDEFCGTHRLIEELLNQHPEVDDHASLAGESPAEPA